MAKAKSSQILRLRLLRNVTGAKRSVRLDAAPDAIRRPFALATASGPIGTIEKRDIETHAMSSISPVGPSRLARAAISSGRQLYLRAVTLR